MPKPPEPTSRPSRPSRRARRRLYFFFVGYVRPKARDRTPSARAHTHTHTRSGEKLITILWETEIKAITYSTAEYNGVYCYILYTYIYAIARCIMFVFASFPFPALFVAAFSVAVAVFGQTRAQMRNNNNNIMVNDKFILSLSLAFRSSRYGRRRTRLNQCIVFVLCQFLMSLAWV